MVWTKEQKRDYNKEWHRTHPHKFKEYSANFRKKHPNYSREHSKKWRKEHPDRKRNGDTKYRKEHSEEIKEMIEIWIKEHPEQYKKLRVRISSKRRQLGFIPLNKSFSGSDGHHIDKIHVVYIPHELHKSVSHNVWTGRGMTEINDKVFEWKHGVVELGEVEWSKVQYSEVRSKEVMGILRYLYKSLCYLISIKVGFLI